MYTCKHVRMLAHMLSKKVFRHGIHICIQTYTYVHLHTYRYHTRVIYSMHMNIKRGTHRTGVEYSTCAGTRLRSSPKLVSERKALSPAMNQNNTRPSG